MTRKQIWVLLADKGFDREQIKEMNIEWIIEVLFPDRDEKTGQPRFLDNAPSRFIPPKSLEDKIRELLWLRGVKTHEMEEQVKKMLDEQRELLKQAGLPVPPASGV